MDALFVGGTLLYGAFCIGYEIYRAAGGQTTISQQTWWFEQRWPAFLFLAGILCGHLFFR